ncbi:adenylyltransferase/cytidyltransferase family protein [bacterium]|nr:MAG: adenylyltransferase/cytidyltransferase family protein [bacterium]
MSSESNTQKKSIPTWRKRLIPQSHLMDLGEKLREKDKKVVYTAGAWDMIHVGQARYLEEAKNRGDILVVGIVSDSVIKRLKGPNRPILGEQLRAEMVASLRCVDFVTIVNEPSSQPVLGLLKPDVYQTVQEDWNKDYKESIEYKTVIKYGGEVVLIDRQSPAISTTKILERTVAAQLSDIFKEYMKLVEKPLKER